MAAVFGVIEDLARFSKDVGRERAAALDGSGLSQELDLVPILPRLERLAVDLSGEADAEALLDVQAGDEHARTARVVGPVFPQGPVRRVVVLTDFDLFDRSLSWNRICAATFPHEPMVYPSA